MAVPSPFTHWEEQTLFPDLRERKQWLVWILEEKEDGKQTKVPYNARTGERASTTDPSTWSTFEEALEAFHERVSTYGTSYTGLGYVFNQDETGIDLDHCIDTHGKIDAWAKKHIERFASYTERSYSKTGIHIIVKGTIPGIKGLRRKVVNQRDERASIEIYSQGRYFVMTGEHLPGTPKKVTRGQDALDELYGKLNAPTKKEKRASPPSLLSLVVPSTLSEHDILERAIDAKNGDKFRSLFLHGNTAGYLSESEADLALCDILAFWCGKDAGRIDRLFRRSALYRDKWDEMRGGQTYGAITIAKAIEGCTETYTAPLEKPKVDLREYQVPVSPPPPPLVPGEALTDEELCEFTADDAGNGDAMYALYGEDFLYCGARGWFRYTGTHWQHDAESAEVTQKAVETLRRRRHAAVDEEREQVIKCTRGDASRVSGCVSRFKTLVNVSIDEFDNDPNVLNCLNGVVDLRTGMITPHKRSQRFTYCVPVPYESFAYDEWLEFLLNVVEGGSEVIDYLQMAVGYSLTGHTSEEVMFYLYGPTRSGKGSFGEAFMSLLPSPLSKSVDFMSFTARRDGDVSNFDLAPLKPSRMIFASESNKSQALNPAKIKQLTGGDDVTCCYKHKDFFSYRPQFKVWMMSNHTVNGDPEDDALWGRVRIIQFPHSFLGMEDKRKKTRLKDPEVQKGILYWAVQGAIKWYALGAKGLTTPAAIAQTTQEHRAELDYIQQWLDECTQHSEGGWSSHEQVMNSYTTWCNDNNVQYPKGKKGLSESLKAKGYPIGKVKEIAGKSYRGIGNLSIL